MERSSWTMIVLVALGAAAVVLAIVPSRWPNPLGEDGPVDIGLSVQLEAAAAAVDAACREGDTEVFAAVTTPRYRQLLKRRLKAVDATLDSATLRAIASDREGYHQWLQRPIWALHVTRQYAGVVVQRSGDDGAQVLVFAWNGERFLLDEVRHATRVKTAPAARRFVVELLRLR